MRLVHALVAEVLRELVHPEEAAHDEALEVQLVGNPEVHVHIQRIVVRDERTGRRAARDGLQDRGLHLQAAGLVEVTAHRGDDLRPLDEGLLHLRVHHEVHVPLAVAEFRIGETVMDGTVGIGLDDGKDAEGLGKDREFLRVDGQLARLGDEGEALDAHDVADVQQFLEYGIIKGLVLAGADLVPLDIDLDASRVVLQLHEGSRAHDAAGHDAAGDADVGEVALLGLEARRDLRGGGVDGVQGGGVGIDAQFADLREGLPPAEFLFVAFDGSCHIGSILKSQ